MIYIKIFWTFFQIGLFSFGGGYAILSLIKDQVVESNHWLTVNEFADLVALSQMTPGPIAINASTFVGTKVAGVGGAVVATLGCITPSAIIVMAVSRIYQKYRQSNKLQNILHGLMPGVAAMIAAAGLSVIAILFWGESGFSLAGIDYVSVALFGISLFLLRRVKIGVIRVILGVGLLSLCVGAVRAWLG